MPQVKLPEYGATAKPIAMMKQLWRDDSGATSIEYGLIATLMAVAILASLKQLGSNTQGSWANTAGKVTNVMQ